MALENYHVDEDEIFISLCSEKNLSQNSIRKYRNCLKNFTNYHQLTLKELVDEAEEDEENNVRPARRRIRSRLLSFRTHLINDLGYKAATIKTNMICAKSLYRFQGIVVPEIPNAVLPSSPNESIEFEDLPTIKHIKSAIESTKKAKHKALFLFAACNGSARMELSTFSFGQFLEGVKPFCNNPESPKDIINDLDGNCDELEVIPVFKMRRHKTDYFYYSPITPEATQFCINYLKIEGQNLTYDDPFFQLSPDGVSTAFKLINEKFQWGKRGLYGFFSSHRIRKFNASIIEDTDFANFIQGRKPNPIKETYFKRDINRIREEYKKHMFKFTIYAHYDVMINSEAYQQLQEQLNDERQLHEEERERLRADYEDEINQLRAQNSSLSSQVTDIETRMSSFTRASELSTMMNYARGNPLVNENNLMPYVFDIYHEILARDENFHPSRANMEDIIAQAYNRRMLENRRNAGVIGQATENFDEIYARVSSIAKQMIERQGFILTQSLTQELESNLMDYAQDIDNEVDANGNWQDLVDNRRISRIVAEVTKAR